MTWRLLKRALEMIWDNLIFPIGRGSRPRLEGITFEVVYDNKKIGAGRLFKFQSASNGTKMVDVSR